MAQEEFAWGGGGDDAAVTGPGEFPSDPERQAKVDSIRQQILALFDSWGMSHVSSGRVTPFVNAWITSYQREFSDRVPDSLQDLVEWDQSVWNGLQWLPYSVAVNQQGAAIPSIFTFQQPDGSGQLMSYSIQRGATPFTVPTGGMGLGDQQFDYNQLMREFAVGSSTAGVSQRGGTPAPTAPVVTSQMLQQALVGAVGGRGGGRVGRQARVFDRDALIEDATNLWRSTLLEQPSNIGAIVDRYISEFNAFWVGEGGQKDFETFLWDEMRKTARHKLLYRWKPDEMHETDFINSYTGYVAGFGMRPELYQEQLERSVTSGAGPAAQAKRIARSPEVVAGSQGTFSQGFASMLAGMGRGARR